jgi:Inward rectifier potassium channel C-terminal domain
VLSLRASAEGDRGGTKSNEHQPHAKTYGGSPESVLEGGNLPVILGPCDKFHIIDKESPLHGVTAPDLEESDALLVLNVGGLDDGSAQQLYARHVYSWRDIRWHHRYKDVTSVSPQGRFLLDYTKFHDVVADE